MDSQATPRHYVAGIVSAFSDRKARKPAAGRGNHDVRHRLGTGDPVSVAGAQYPDAVGGQHGLSDYPWSAGCDESCTSSAEGGSEKRAGSNPGVALRPTLHHRKDEPVSNRDDG